MISDAFTTFVELDRVVEWLSQSLLSSLWQQLQGNALTSIPKSLHFLTSNAIQKIFNSMIFLSFIRLFDNCLKISLKSFLQLTPFQWNVWFSYKMYLNVFNESLKQFFGLIDRMRERRPVIRLWFRRQPIWNRSAEFKCGPDVHLGVIWPKSMPCIGALTPGISRLMANIWTEYWII